MIPRIPIPQSLLDLIATQEGAVTSAQALRHGLTPASLRRVATAWTTIGNGVHVVGEVTWRAFAWAALLRGGDGAALGGAAAAHVLGLIRQPHPRLTLWASTQHVPLSHGSLHAVYRRGERRSWGQLRRTTVEESLLDMACEADDHLLVEAITRACAQGSTTPSRLMEELAARPRQARRRLIEQVCTVASTGIESVLEWLFQERVLHPHRLLAPARQVRSPQGHRVDVWFEEAGVMVELDGRSFHDVEADAMRDNEHALALGVVTLRFTWRQILREPCRVARTIVEALRARGHARDARPCPSCSSL